MMKARVATWEPMPTDDRQWVLDAAKTVPGVVAAYHLIDPDSGNGLSITIVEDETDGAAIQAAIKASADEIGWHDQPRPALKSETFYRVMRHV
jgi:hypothetical protein